MLLGNQVYKGFLIISGSKSYKFLPLFYINLKSYIVTYGDFRNIENEQNF